MLAWLSPFHAFSRRFFQLVSQMTTVYNVKLSGTAKTLYADSTSAFSWASFDWDGASAHLTHIAMIISCSHLRDTRAWQTTSCLANASPSASATGC